MGDGRGLPSRHPSPVLLTDIIYPDIIYRATLLQDSNLWAATRTPLGWQAALGGFGFALYPIRNPSVSSGDLELLSNRKGTAGTPFLHAA